MAKSASRKHLEKALGTTTTDAIAGLAREVAEEVITAYMANEDNLQALRNRLADLVTERGADDPEIRSAVQTVVTASREHDATDVSDEAAVAEDTARTEAAEQAVEALEQGSEDAGSQPEAEPTPEPADEVDEPAPAPRAEPNSDPDLAAMVLRHEAILVSGNPVNRRPVSRLDDMQGEIDSIQHHLDVHEGVTASAFAQARASVVAGNNLREAGVWGAIAFIATFLVSAVVVMISPLQWDWLNIIGISAVVAGLVVLVAWLRNYNPGVEVLSYAEAVTIVEADNRRRGAVLFEADEDIDDEPVEYHVASAHAHAGVR